MGVFSEWYRTLCTLSCYEYVLKIFLTIMLLSQLKTVELKLDKNFQSRVKEVKIITIFRETVLKIFRLRRKFMFKKLLTSNMFYLKKSTLR